MTFCAKPLRFTRARVVEFTAGVYKHSAPPEPACYRRLQLESIAVGGVNRALSARPFPGGKAAHVAMVAQALALEVTVTEILESGGGVTDGEVDRLLSVCRDISAESREGSQVALSGSLAVACGTANCPAESPGLVDPLEVERIMQQVSVQSLQPGWREVKTQGGAG